jgi:hypothetical protein
LRSFDNLLSLAQHLHLDFDKSMQHLRDTFDRSQRFIVAEDDDDAVGDFSPTDRQPNIEEQTDRVPPLPDDWDEARLREVDRRYAKPTPTLDSIRRAELMRLYRHRFPGLSEVQLTGKIDDALQCAPMDVSADECGRCVKLTLVERSDLGIRTIAAYDASAAEAEAFYRGRRRERDRLRGRVRRDRKRRKRPTMPSKTSKADLRINKVLALLRQQSERDPKHWSTVEDIAMQVARSKAFTGLTRKSVRNAINRSLDGLADIEQDTVVGKNSLPTRFVRVRTQLSADTKKMVPTPKNVRRRSEPL